MDALKTLLEDFDLAALLPDLTSVMGWMETVLRLAVLAGPILLLVLGLIWFLKPPAEANHSFGFRCYFGMGSVSAWRYTQRLAGLILAPLGLVLTVVMLVISIGFSGAAPDAMVYTAVKCLLWEAGLICAAYLAITLVVSLTYDRAGNLRHPEKARKRPAKKQPRKSDK